VRSLLRSLARNTATLVDNKTLELDVKTSDKNEVSRNTISEYLDALSRLMILLNNLLLIHISAHRRRCVNHLNDICATHLWLLLHWD
jgi:predicted AAA+ superfamily ATPase